MSGLPIYQLNQEAAFDFAQMQKTLNDLTVFDLLTSLFICYIRNQCTYIQR